MRLNFTALSGPMQKTVGHSGTGGTPSIHAGLDCPTCVEKSWDTLGQSPASSVSTPADNLSLSHLSHSPQNEVGHGEPCVYAAVPLVPPVPPEKCMNEITHEVFEERAAIMEYDGGMERTQAERLALLHTRYLLHHWGCKTCCAAGQVRGQRCSTGAALWQAYDLGAAS